MTEQVMTDIVTTAQPAAPVVSPPAEVKNTENMIPKSRLDEVIAKNKELESQLAAREKAAKEAAENALKEQGKYQELYEAAQKELAETRPLASIAKDSEKTLKQVLDAQIEDIPEPMRTLIPEELSTQQKLTWLSKNKSLLMKPKPFDIGAGRQGGTAESAIELTPEQLATARRLGIKPEDYAKNL
jgi:hypothetical protein